MKLVNLFNKLNEYVVPINYHVLASELHGKIRETVKIPLIILINLES